MPIQTHSGHMPLRSLVARPRGRAKRTIKSKIVELITKEQSEISSQLAVRRAPDVHVLIRLRGHSGNCWQNAVIVCIASVADYVPQPAQGP